MAKQKLSEFNQYSIDALKELGGVVVPALKPDVDNYIVDINEFATQSDIDAEKERAINADNELKAELYDIILSGDVNLQTDINNIVFELQDSKNLSAGPGVGIVETDEAIVISAQDEAPDDGKVYGKQGENWVEVITEQSDWAETNTASDSYIKNKPEDVPNDDIRYERMNGEWIEAADSWKTLSEKQDCIGPGIYIGSNNETVEHSIAFGENNIFELPQFEIETNDTQNLSIGLNNTLNYERPSRAKINTIQLGIENKIEGLNFTPIETANFVQSGINSYNIGTKNYISGEGINIGKFNSADCFGVNIGQYGYASNGSISLNVSNNSALRGSIVAGSNNKASFGSYTFGTNSTAMFGSKILGEDSSATYGSVIIGNTNSANYASTAFGIYNISNNISFIVGTNNTATNRSYVFGNGNNADHSYILGDSNRIVPGLSNHKIIGDNNTALGTVTIIGNGNISPGNDSFIFGHKCYANKSSMVLQPGWAATSADNNSIAINIGGSESYSSCVDAGSVTIGHNLSATNDSVVIGKHNSASYGSTTLGMRNYATSDSTCIGGTTYGPNITNSATNGSLVIGIGGFGATGVNYANGNGIIVGSTYRGNNYANGGSLVLSNEGAASATSCSIAIGKHLIANSEGLAIGSYISANGGYGFGRYIKVQDESICLNTHNNIASASNGSLILKSCGAIYRTGATSANNASVIIGGQNVVTNASTAIGAGNYIQNWSIALGNLNIAGFDETNYELITSEATMNTHALMLGYNNSVHSKNWGGEWTFKDKTGEYNTAEKYYTQNIVLGSNNKVNNHNSTVIGAGNNVFASINSACLTANDGYNITAASAVNEGYSVVFGRSNTAGNQFDFIQGKHNILSGTDDVGYNTVFGINNTLINCSKNTILGSNNTLTNVSGQTIIGDYSESSDKILIIANGTSTKNSNAMTVDSDGTVSAAKYIQPIINSTVSNITPVPSHTFIDYGSIGTDVTFLLDSIKPGELYNTAFQFTLTADCNIILNTNDNRLLHYDNLPESYENGKTYQFSIINNCVSIKVYI